MPDKDNNIFKYNHGVPFITYIDMESLLEKISICFIIILINHQQLQ